MDPTGKFNEYCAFTTWKLYVGNLHGNKSLMMQIVHKNLRISNEEKCFEMEHDVLLQVFFSLKEN